MEEQELRRKLQKMSTIGDGIDEIVDFIKDLKVDCLIEHDNGEKVGRTRTLKWVLFFLSYKSISDVKDLMKRTIERDEKEMPELKQHDRY